MRKLWGKILWLISGEKYKNCVHKGYCKYKAGYKVAQQAGSRRCAIYRRKNYGL